MRNGGGPACLRLRVVLTEEQLRSVRGNVLLTEELYGRLRDTIEAYYPNTVSFADLADLAFVGHCREATAQLHAVFAINS